jgi:hypothetical protein
MEPKNTTQGRRSLQSQTAAPRRRVALCVAVAAVVGVLLVTDSLTRSSATYDEVAYLRIAARWWRTGNQELITRMGSPLSFWKLQQTPTLWAVDRSGFGWVLDDPEPHQAILLPLLRFGSVWIWLAAFALTVWWSGRVHGPWAMAFSAWMFALSPNLLAHGALITMEMPTIACSAGVFASFERFLATGRRAYFCVSAALAGLAFSCKFTAVLFPAILAACWLIEQFTRRWSGPWAATRTVVMGMAGYMLLMIGANLIATKFAVLPLSERVGAHPSVERYSSERALRIARRAMETPIPQDWVGFIKQSRHQSAGGSSYLFGETRVKGWWYYYLVALAVKAPLAFWCLAGSRVFMGSRTSSDRFIILAVVLFLTITMIGSSRNYGVRYVLPMAPLVIVWLSGLVEGGRWARGLAIAGIVGQGIAVATIHPHELTYFNQLAGGPVGGRRILADSNLDWGQGLKSFARLQERRPEFKNVTLYYFGDTRPAYYRVVGKCYVIDAGVVHPALPPVLEADTSYLAVSASLQFGPWGPSGYFRALDGASPVAWSDDRTITVYRTEDVEKRPSEGSL